MLPSAAAVHTNFSDSGQQNVTDELRRFAARDGREQSGSHTKNTRIKSNTFNSRISSLFGFLDNTYTACGSRLLRVNLLQPLTDINTVHLRLDSLQVCCSIHNKQQHQIMADLS